MKTLNTAMWHEQKMKLCLKFNYHNSQNKKIPHTHFPMAFKLYTPDAPLII